jgi:hypothetical protein
MAISLSSITKNPVLAPPRVIIYGPHKIGKSTWATKAPNPILVPTEEGIGNLSVAHFPILREYSEVIEALSSLFNEEHEFNTVVIDSLDWLEPIIWRETSRRHGCSNIEEVGKGFGKGYVFACDVWREFLDWLNALRSSKNMAIVLTAHCQVKRFDDPTTEPYDRYSIKLQDRASSLVQEWADAILFANYRTFTTKTDVGFNQKKTRGTGTGERILFTEERPSHLAGNRYSLPTELSLDWNAFQDALINSTKPLNK